MSQEVFKEFESFFKTMFGNLDVKIIDVAYKFNHMDVTNMKRKIKNHNMFEPLMCWYNQKGLDHMW